MNLERFKTQQDWGGFPLTAMIDVMFLMVIFLVLAANFDTVDTVRLPEGLGKPQPQQQAVLRLQLRADGNLWLEGRMLGESGKPGEARAQKEAEVLKRLKARNPTRIVLLPDEKGAIGPLFRWYHRLRAELDIPVQVGVRAPTEQPSDQPSDQPSN